MAVQPTLWHASAEVREPRCSVRSRTLRAAQWIALFYSDSFRPNHARNFPRYAAVFIWMTYPTCCQNPNVYAVETLLRPEHDRDFCELRLRGNRADGERENHRPMLSVGLLEHRSPAVRDSRNSGNQVCRRLRRSQHGMKPTNSCRRNAEQAATCRWISGELRIPIPILHPTGILPRSGNSLQNLKSKSSHVG